MAVFMLNVCKFAGCERNFPCLGDLVLHIEESHVAEPTQERPTSLPLSCVLRCYAARPPPAAPVAPTEHRRSSAEEDGDGEGDKPYICPIAGCKKRYKNVNGIKYHTKYGHDKDGKIKKAYKCHCGKSYKTTHGLKNHTVTQHQSSSSSDSTQSTPTTSSLKPLSLPVMKALQGYVTQTRLASNQVESKIVKSVLDTGKKLTKETLSTITTLTLPRQSIGSLHLEPVPMMHTKFETDSSIDSQSNASHFSEIVIPHNLGILTPAASPISNVIKQSDGTIKIVQSALSPQIDEQSMPLTPAPSNEDEFAAQTAH